MSDELADLLDTAVYKEIASQALYIAGQSRTEDHGAKALMQELAAEELSHSRYLKQLKNEGTAKLRGRRRSVPDLKLSEYLTAPDTLEGAGIQETLLFAMRREQDSVDFYSRMMSVIGDREAKRVCLRLAEEELRHKLKLETLYDDLFYVED